MRILFLTHYFPPEVNAPASRTFEHCKVWAKQGHEIVALTNVPNHPAGRIYPGFRNRLWQKETMNGIQVVRMLTITAPNRGVVRRSLNYAFYMVASMVYSLFLPRADVVISTSPQFLCGLAGYFVSRIKRVPWVLEIRDIWPESVTTVGAIKQGRLIRMLEWLEHFVYRKADRIISVTDSFVPRIAASCGDPGKIHVIKNGVDLEFFKPNVGTGSLRESLNLQSRFVAAYVGTHGMAHGLDVILDAAVLLRDRPDVVLLMAGDGAERARLAERRASLQLDNVLMLGQLPKEQMPEIWGLTDVSLVLLRNQPLFNAVLPSKIFEAMGMAVPIILGVQGESARLVSDSGGGICIQPENATDLAAAVRSMADNPTRARAMGKSGRVYVEQHFDRSALARRLEMVIRQLVEAPGRN
jgi:glycosyltransferase involved in cell wall biosynthesis